VSESSSPDSEATAGAAWFSDAPEEEVRALLHDVCAGRAWSKAVLADRPYAGPESLLAAGERATLGRAGTDLDEAIAGHPPIGRPTAGDPVSATEQSGVGDAHRRELLELNLAYQERFGHVFLICATGRTGPQMLAALKERLGNSAEREREIARTELAGINRLRLERLLRQRGSAAAKAPGRAATVSTHILDTAAGRPATGVAVELSVRTAPGVWESVAASATDGDGRCKDLPALPEDSGLARLRFETGPYLARGAGEAFFPEASVTFVVEAGEHYHVPLLLSPYGYSVYRGS
jgi:2-oxo-4-hydroxy-4-carboxy-5-ureidoimidazoline decarboxylase